uniref:Uncharacterized protein n=1 Tax=Populus alba TaxID=43335 RepID=A0A4U5R3P0_POPAL|nr:hypothetical protein D5086_0000000910 [Populus alba]
MFRNVALLPNECDSNAIWTDFNLVIFNWRVGGTDSSCSYSCSRYPCNAVHLTGGFSRRRSQALTELDSELRTSSCGGSTEESTMLNAMARLIPSPAVAPSPRV